MRLNDYGLVIKDCLTDNRLDLNRPIKYKPATAVAVLYNGLHKVSIAIGTDSGCGGCAVHGGGGASMKFKNLFDMRHELYEFSILLLKKSAFPQESIINALNKLLNS